MNITYIPSPQPSYAHHLNNGFTLFIYCMSFISLFFICCVYFKRHYILCFFTYITFHRQDTSTQVAIPLHTEINIEIMDIPIAIVNNQPLDTTQQLDTTNDIIATEI
jgi:hypothetical protein